MTKLEEKFAALTEGIQESVRQAGLNVQEPTATADATARQDAPKNTALATALASEEEGGGGGSASGGRMVTLGRLAGAVASIFGRGQRDQIGEKQLDALKRIEELLKKGNEMAAEGNFA